MSNFSFSLSVFTRPVLQTCENQGLFGKRVNKASPFTKQSYVLTLYHTIKILDHSKLKALAADTINSNKNLRLVSGRVENALGKGDNAGYRHFLFFSKCYQKPLSSESSKVEIAWKKSYRP